MGRVKKISIGFGIVFMTLLIPITVSAQTTEIPSWVKGVADFWVKGNIEDNEFGEAISFLIEQEIIKVNMPQQNNNAELEKKISQLEFENSELLNGINDLKNKNSKLQSGNNEKMNSDVTCDEFYYDVMHFSIVDALYGRIAESAESYGHTNDNEDALKAAKELSKIASFNGFNDEDLERFRVNCSDQLTEEQNLAKDFLLYWGEQFGFYVLLGVYK
ncbi:bZIP transcription factor [Nitrosopumilus ureiphilus]|uniref:Uncharacterized protein n=1 Tax=Nitrosopumilus ureiphilus TaxID=1470067 RepID=A0A7D5M6K2_9ARCH|nr:bZIP transcription factor [Nitrosopumilus ureiphilus]QLH07675.1 hypothetical protein C5F50_11785 [Nitrosopumilus ureiphilus]